MMMHRCYKRSSDHWKDYGGRGIKVYGPWHDYLAFKKDMGIRPEGMTLDRIDPNGHYTPSNCQWGCVLTQAIHRRSNWRGSKRNPAPGVYKRASGRYHVQVIIGSYDSELEATLVSALAQKLCESIGRGGESVPPVNT
jgi:hypothetical protein